MAVRVYADAAWRMLDMLTVPLVGGGKINESVIVTGAVPVITSNGRTPVEALTVVFHAQAICWMWSTTFL